MPTIKTKKNEKIICTSNTDLLLNLYLTKTIFRTTPKTFVDDRTGEVINTEAKEFLAARGALVNPELASKIKFHQEAGEIDEVEVSDVARYAEFIEFGYFTPYLVVAKFDRTPLKVMCYAKSAEMAIEIAKDFIEQKYAGGCFLATVRAFGDCIYIEDASYVKKMEAEEKKRKEKDKKKDDGEPSKVDDIKKIKTIFYQIAMNFRDNEKDEYGHTHNFLIKTDCIESAQKICTEWYFNRVKKDTENGDRKKDEKISIITTTLVAKPVSIHEVVSREFSDMYKD